LQHYLAAGCAWMQTLSLFNRDAWQRRIRQHRFRLRDVSDMADSHVRHANMLFTKGYRLEAEERSLHQVARCGVQEWFELECLVEQAELKNARGDPRK